MTAVAALKRSQMESRYSFATGRELLPLLVEHLELTESLDDILVLGKSLGGLAELLLGLKGSS